MPRTKQLIILFLVIVSGIFGSNCYSQNIKSYSFLSFVGLTAGHIGGDRQLSCEVVKNVYKPARDVSFGGVLGFELDTSLNWFNQHSPGTTFGVGLALFTDIKNKGTVFQEGVFENLAYQYQSQNNALFAQIKKSVALKNNREISFLLGVGADLVISKRYSESPIDSSSIAKSNTFKRHSQLRPAMVAGIYHRLAAL